MNIPLVIRLTCCAIGYGNRARIVIAVCRCRGVPYKRLLCPYRRDLCFLVSISLEMDYTRINPDGIPIQNKESSAVDYEEITKRVDSEMPSRFLDGVSTASWMPISVQT